MEKNTLSVLFSYYFYLISYYCLVVHFKGALVVAFFETFVAFYFPVLARVLVVDWLWFWFLFFLLRFFGTVVSWALLVLLVAIWLLLGVGCHEPSVEEIGKVIKNVIPLIGSLTRRLAGLLVHSEDSEGIEAEEHLILGLCRG